jgi:hypothetical protein
VTGYINVEGGRDSADFGIAQVGWAFRGWTAGPGNPIGSPTIANGAPDYGDQPTTSENLSVIAGWEYEQQNCGK